MAWVDPAGEETDRERLRGLGKWRFIFVRGLVGFGGPIFLWQAISSLKEDIHKAKLVHEDVFQYVVRSWLTGLFIAGFLACVVGLLAWRRLTSEYWPDKPPDPEASHIRLGPLNPR